MALRYTYSDAALVSRVTQADEDQAAAEVTMLGTFPTAWVDRMTILRTYLTACIRLQLTTEDVFAAKLKTYRAEFDSALAQARVAQAKAEADAGTAPTGGGSVFSIDLQRA